MYAAHFGLNENPFNLSPDPRYLYYSSQHREALNCLVYGINERKGFIVITGEIGTGKTTVCRTLMSRLDESFETALIFNSAVSDLELLEAVNKELGVALPAGERTKKQCVDALNEYLLERYTQNKIVVLLIDEAQNLSHSTLEQIRMLSNLETVREKLLQIVLIGQPELQEILSVPSMRQLNERITIRCHISSLNRANVRDYIQHRIDVAAGRQGNDDLLTRPAHRLIYRYSMGNPRRINAICDRAFLIAYAKDKAAVTRGCVRAAVRDIGFSYFSPKKKLGRRRLGWISICMIIVVAAVVFINADWLLSHLSELSP